MENNNNINIINIQENKFININKKKSENILRVLQFNILAQSLLQQSIRLSNKNLLETNKFFKWEFRMELIIKIIKQLNCDLICFQEFENESKFNSKLNELNYSIIFKKRPGKEKKEGCAILFSNKKFTLVKKYELEFNIENFNHNIYNKENVCLFLILKNIKNNKHYLIINSHILYNHSRGDIKLAQVFQIFNCIEIIKEKFNNFDLNIIFCCDLNCTYNSIVYNYITNDNIYCKDLDIKLMSGQFNTFYKLGNETEFYFKLKNIKKLKYKDFITDNEKNKLNLDLILNTYPRIIEDDSKIILNLIIDYKSNNNNLNKNNKNNNKNNNNNNLNKNNNNNNNNLNNNNNNNLNNNNNNLNINNKNINNLNNNNNNNNYYLKNNNPLKSAYLTITSKEPLMTYYNPGNVGTFDFIFHSSNLFPIQCLKIPYPLNFIFEKNKIIPDKKNPSDHFPLCVDFI